MNKWSVQCLGQICCKCGKAEEIEKVVEGFCLSCYAEEFPLIKKFPEKELALTACKLCGDLMYHSKWHEVEEDPVPAIYEVLEKFIEKAKKTTSTELVGIGSFEIPEFDVAHRGKIPLVFEGTPNKEVPPYQQEIFLDLVVNIGVCDRCGRYSRGYFEAIVQIRSDRRNLTEDEQSHISDLINQKKEEMLEIDRMAYISKTVDQHRGGIDLYIGSDSFAKSLASFLAEQLAATIEHSKKLKSMKDGRPIYQSTYCVRVPYFEIGDVVSYQKEPHQVQGFNFGRVVLFKLKNQEEKTLSYKESNSEFLKVLKKKDQLQKHIIMSIQEPHVSLMNSISFETIDIDVQYIFPNHSDGEEILIVELEEGFFECKDL